VPRCVGDIAPGNVSTTVGFRKEMDVVDASRSLQSISDRAAPISFGSATGVTQFWCRIQLTIMKLCMCIHCAASSCTCATHYFRHDRVATARQSDPICTPQQMIAKEPPAAPGWAGRRAFSPLLPVTEREVAGLGGSLTGTHQRCERTTGRC